jgi:hypothetical protein
MAAWHKIQKDMYSFQNISASCFSTDFQLKLTSIYSCLKRSANLIRELGSELPCAMWKVQFFVHNNEKRRVIWSGDHLDHWTTRTRS